MVVPIIAAITITVIVLIGYFGLRSNQSARDTLNQAKSAYQRALDNLAASPAEPNVRQDALRLGRVYYAITLPDTQTEHGPLGLNGTSDYQSNTAGREARIAADIEARIGHLKAKEAPASAPSDARPTKKCPDCAELILEEARKCRFCGHTFD